MKSPVVIETLEVARQDGCGRRLAGGAEREALLAAFAQSGMTQQAFAQREGINRFSIACLPPAGRHRAARVVLG